METKIKSSDKEKIRQIFNNIKIISNCARNALDIDFSNLIENQVLSTKVTLDKHFNLIQSQIEHAYSIMKRIEAKKE